MHKELSNKLDSLLKEAHEKSDSEPKIAEKIASNVLISATEIGSKEQMKDANICILRSLIFQGKYKLAKNKGYHILRTFDLDTCENGEVCHLISTAYYYTFAYDKAIEYGTRTLKLFQNCNDQEGIASIYNLLALSYKKKHEYYQAIRYLELSFEMKKEIPDISDINLAVTLENIGNFHLSLKEYDRALIYYNQAIETYIKEQNNYRYTNILNNLGFTYWKLQRFKIALEHSEKAYQISKLYHFTNLQSYAAINLGNLQYEQKQYRLALDFGMEAKNLSDSIALVDEAYIRMFLLLSNSYMQLDERDKGLYMALEGLKFNDSLETKTSIALYENIIAYYSSKQDYQNCFVYQNLKEKTVNTCHQSQLLYEKRKTAYQFEIEGKNREIEMQQQQLQKEQKFKEKLQESNIYLNEFIDVFTHDIKAPIRHIQGFSSLLKRKINAESHPQHIEFIDTINASSNLLTEMIDALYSYAKIGADSYKMSFISLEKTIDNIKTIFYNSIHNDGAQINVNISHKVFSEKTLLFQLFQNIIQNSLKYAKEGVTPIIDISSESNNEFTIISFIDNGIGIHESELQRIFFPFSRSKMVKNQKEGLGIGLATCYKIMKLHQGKIVADSMLGEGTTFKLYFPNTTA